LACRRRADPSRSGSTHSAALFLCGADRSAPADGRIATPTDSGTAQRIDDFTRDPSLCGLSRRRSQESLGPGPPETQRWQDFHRCDSPPSRLVPHMPARRSPAARDGRTYRSNQLGRAVWKGRAANVSACLAHFQ
jgi:hypothetical protein